MGQSLAPISKVSFPAVSHRLLLAQSRRSVARAANPLHLPQEPHHRPVRLLPPRDKEVVPRALQPDEAALRQGVGQLLAPGTTVSSSPCRTRAGWGRAATASRVVL